jgi:ubiquinone/menaquinone biosynthesis C-methylase UbiE
LQKNKEITLNNAKKWFEDDCFWETFTPVFFSQCRLGGTSAEVDKILSLVSLQPSAAILDLCCGVGRHSIEFARRGFNVTGVDRTLSYLNLAQQRASENELQVQFIQSDMREFSNPDSFNAALSLFTSFGYFEDINDDRKVLRNLYTSLKKDGFLLMDLMSKELVARRFQERIWYEVEGFIVLQEHHLQNDWTRIKNRWIILKDNH